MQTTEPRIITTQQSSSFGINLIGDLTGNIGLGVTARAIAALLKSKNIPFSFYNLDFAWGERLEDLPFAEHQINSIEKLCHPINLYILPITTLHSLSTSHPAFFTVKRLHIANIWWEASHLPESWLNALNQFDGVLAMSHFIAELCQNSLTLVPTLYGKHPLHLPELLTKQREDFYLADDNLVFAASFDANSDPARKNPFALIRTFRHSFGVDDTKVRLLIRVNNSDSDIGQQVVKKMYGLIGGDARIRLLLEPMAYADVMSLYACADIYLSYHRGEGLGLGMLESMALGKPVIATGWSGNLSFMNQTNSALLRYKLIPADGTYYFLKQDFLGASIKWADPALEDAVAWMRELRNNTELREKLGTQAKLSAEDYLNEASTGEWLNELHRLWLNQRYLPQGLYKLSRLK